MMIPMTPKRITKPLEMQSGKKHIGERQDEGEFDSSSFKRSNLQIFDTIGATHLMAYEHIFAAASGILKVLYYRIAAWKIREMNMQKEWKARQSIKQGYVVAIE